MRKFLLSVLLAASVSGVFAQKIDDVKEKIQKGKYDEAKEKIDKVLADAKNQSNSEAWFLKAKVYQNLAKQTKDTAMSATAFDAMRTYLQLEEGVKDQAKRNLASMLENNQTVFDFYSTYFQNGAQSFNNKKYDEAYYNFSRAVTAFDMLQKYKFTNVPFDTTTILYAGVAAENLKNTDQAVQYYQRIADQKIADTTLRGVYEYVVNYYSGKKDFPTAQKYLEIGRSLYPNYNGWLSYELNMVDGSSKDAQMTKYEELIKKYPNNNELALDYVIQLLNYTYSNEKKPADYAVRQEKLNQALQDIISKNPKNAMANYLMSRHINNQIADLEEELRAVKGNAAPEAAKRKDFNAKIAAKNDELAKYSQQAFDLYSANPNLKTNEKIYLREVTNNLVYYYQLKKQNDKVTFYQNKLKSL